MPTYEYACTSCGVHLDVVQAFSDAPLETCARCGGKLRRVFHPAAVLFRGSGFYSTDSKSRKADGEASKKAPDSAKADTASAKSDTSASSSASSAEGAGTSTAPK